MSYALETNRATEPWTAAVENTLFCHRFFFFAGLNNTTKTAWPIHSFSLPLCLPVISSVSIYFSFASAFTGKQSLSRPGGWEGVNSSHSSEWVILSFQMHDNINYNWAINKTLEMTIHKLSCKQILKKHKTLCFQLQQQFYKFDLYFQTEDFPIKNFKNNMWRGGLSKTLFGTSNLHGTVQVTDVVPYLHFEN